MARPTGFSETAQAKAAGSPTSTAVTKLADTAASWMPQQVAEFWTQSLSEMARAPWPASGLAKDAWDYWVDSCQRTVLFWDVMRKRGNQAIEHYQGGKPPVLVFDYELVDRRPHARAAGQLHAAPHQA